MIAVAGREHKKKTRSVFLIDVGVHPAMLCGALYTETRSGRQIAR